MDPAGAVVDVIGKHVRCAEYLDPATGQFVDHPGHLWVGWHRSASTSTVGVAIRLGVGRPGDSAIQYGIGCLAVAGDRHLCLVGLVKNGS